jgi:hypothetical protein
MSQNGPETVERQHTGGQVENQEHEGQGGKKMTAPAFQLMASPVVQRATPGARYEQGNSPDPNNSLQGAEIRSSEGRIANVGDNVTFTVHGLSGYRSITWRAVNDLTYSPGGGASSVYHSNRTGPSVTLGARVQGVHNIIATVTPESGSAFELSYRLNVEPEDRDYADISSVRPSPLSTMADFIALVERIENAYSTLAWQDVVSKIRMEHYPGRGGEGSGILRAFTWDDLIDDQDEVAPLQSSIAAPADIAALRSTQSVSYNGRTIDIGHVLTGVDAMNFPTTAGIFSRHNMSGPAAATWSGDVGSALTHWATNNPISDTSDAGKQRFYNSYSSIDDLLGDMDGINLGGMPSLPANAKLSQRLRTYYQTNQSTGADKRYTNFCAVSGFDVQNGRLTAAARTYIRQQILNFARGFNIKGSMADAMILSGGGMGGMGGGYVSPETIAMTSGARITDNIDWFANKFIADLEAGLAAE